jgi:phospholipid/cholesterol/gamma-HCH transport system substrate-binding protein
MGRNPIETIMGAVVLLVAGLFLAFAYSTADLADVEGYHIQARFAKVGGLQTGSDVRISGIKIGTVSGQRLDPQTYQAIIDLTIMPSVRLPVDTVASIASDGLLGGSYLKLEPGTESETLAEDTAVRKVRDYKSLEDLVSQIIFLATQDAPPAEKDGFQ